MAITMLQDIKAKLQRSSILLCNKSLAHRDIDTYTAKKADIYILYNRFPSDCTALVIFVCTIICANATNIAKKLKLETKNTYKFTHDPNREVKIFELSFNVQTKLKTNYG